MNEHVTLELLDEIGAAFARHDISAMVSYFHEAGEFVNAVGPDHFGTRYVGHARIRSYFEQLFAATESVQWEKTDVRIVGDKAYTEWRRKATLKTGETQDWQGTDIFTFRHMKILKKDTYIKHVSP